MEKSCIFVGWLYNAPDHIGWKQTALPNDYSISPPRKFTIHSAGLQSTSVVTPAK